MRYLVAYDISTTEEVGKKRLFLIAKVMERYGVRVQKSVFECLLSEAKFQQLLLELEGILKLSQDSLLIYRLGGNARILRMGRKDEDPLTEESFVL
jgi:CRISPR-associated protein Cas2